MGEQTPIQTQTQTPSEPLHSQSLEEPTSQSQEPTVSQPPSTDFSQTPSSSSKIPIRPQKIRKLSSNASVSAAAAVDDKSPVESADGESSKSLSVSQDTNAAAAKSRRRNSSRSARVLPSIIKPLSSEGEIDRAIRHLRAADPLLASLIDSHPPPIFESHHQPFLALTRSILYQQLANKAGTSIYTRFLELCGGEDGVRPDVVLGLSTQQLRQIGISGRKAIYLYDLANKYTTGILSDNSIVAMDDKSLFTMLTMVKGIGAWSVHMFMIFSLHRPDVLPVGDVGVRKGVQLLYGLDELPRPSQMEQLCEKWKPYRSVGAWYMWRFVEGKGAQPVGGVPALEGIVPLQQQMAEQQQQHQLQLLEPISSIANFGPCIWGQ
ncbi:alkylbase DNA glycosidase-like protein mag2 [Cornus florida]|uniref:alkylbase DNA glycosidase-like protein mag2 n=1 Tax=Cornus florida TaxID=4283 RepID=UPI00289A6816|nr:alkylbase DNA glycosidase-like protein mag2 [Cornus florida]